MVKGGGWSPAFVGHQGPRCLKLSVIHCRCVVLEPHFYLCFSPSTTQPVSCNAATCHNSLFTCRVPVSSPGEVSGHPLQATSCTDTSFLTSSIRVSASDFSGAASIDTLGLAPSWVPTTRAETSSTEHSSVDLLSTWACQRWGPTCRMQQHPSSVPCLQKLPCHFCVF